MAKLKSELEVTCPCCRASLVIDTNLGRVIAHREPERGVKPELEVFDTGHLVFVRELIRDGLLDDPIMIQLCMGIAYGAPDDVQSLMAMVNLLPEDAVFSAFSNVGISNRPS